METPVLLDKDALIGACVRLHLVVDLPRLVSEVGALPETLWGTGGGRVGVHRPAEAVFLRGHAPAEGAKPIEDRGVLDALPYVRELIEHTIPAPAQRCLLAKLKPGGVIAPHKDRGDYFARTIRVHVPIVTSEEVIMHCRGLDYRMRAGEVWALNNSNIHAVISDWELPRTHLICDFMPTPELEQLLHSGDRALGVARRESQQRLSQVLAQRDT